MVIVLDGGNGFAVSVLMELQLDADGSVSWGMPERKGDERGMGLERNLAPTRSESRFGCLPEAPRTTRKSDIHDGPPTIAAPAN